MYVMLSFALAVATAFFLITVVIASVHGYVVDTRGIGDILWDALGHGLLAGCLACLGTIVCCVSDGQKRSGIRKKVRRRLLKREPVTDRDFCLHFVGFEETFLLGIRRTLAATIDVPPEHIHPDDRMADLQFEAFEPALHIALVTQALPSDCDSNRMWKFPEEPVETITDLAREVRRVVQQLSTDL